MININNVFFIFILSEREKKCAGWIGECFALISLDFISRQKNCICYFMCIFCLSLTQPLSLPHTHTQPCSLSLPLIYFLNTFLYLYFFVITLSSWVFLSHFLKLSLCQSLFFSHSLSISINVCILFLSLCRNFVLLYTFLIIFFICVLCYTFIFLSLSFFFLSLSSLFHSVSLISPSFSVCLLFFLSLSLSFSAFTLSFCLSLTRFLILSYLLPHSFFPLSLV
jgi:hypothetical protein